MKRILLLLVVGFLSSPIFGQSIMTDDFSSYNNATLSGQGGWDNNSSTLGTGSCSGAICTNTPVVTSTMTYANYQTASKAASMYTNGGNTGKAFTTVTSGSVYVSFLVNFSSVASSSTVTDGEFFRMGGGTGFSNLGCRIGANSSASGLFKFSAGKESIAATTTKTTTDYATNTTHLVVVKYTINTGGSTDDEIKVYVDPTAGPSSSEPGSAQITVAIGTDNIGTGPQRVVLYTNPTTSPTGQLSAIRVSSTWAGLFPTCAQPNSVAASSVTSSSATVSWSGSGMNITDFEYENTSGSFTGVNTSTSNATSVNLTGLTPNTTYNFRVRTNCGATDGYSSYGTISFTTQPTCVTPTTLTTSNVGATSAQLNFTQPAGSANTPTTWEYQTSGTNMFTTILTSGTLSSNPGTITGLSQSTFYYVRVRAVCTMSDQSAWSTSANFTTTATCIAPNTLVSSAVTGTTATVSWTQPAGSVNAPATWEYETTTGSFTGTATGTVSSPTVNLTGLVGSTTYYLRVRAICGVGDNSAWSSSTSFTTACGTININSTPYTLDFESTSAGSLPTCWVSTTISGAPSNNVTQSYSFPNCSACGSTKAFKVGYATAVARVALPTFDASSLTSVEVSFDVSEDNGASAYDDNIKVQYSTDGSTWNDLDIVRRYNANSSSSATYRKRYFTLPAAAISSTLRVALYCTSVNSFSSNNIYLDNLRVGSGTAIVNANDDACNTATGVNGTSVNGKNWTRFTSASGIVAEINPNGNNLGVTTVTIKENATVPSASGVFYLPRTVTITPTTQPSTAVDVRLYFPKSELDDYNTASGRSETMSTLRLNKKNGVANCEISGGTYTELTPTGVVYGSSSNGFYLQFSTTSFSSFAAAQPSAVLPVEFASIKATKMGYGNRIAWTTATEKNVVTFLVERSTNGQTDWTSIGSVKAAGNSTTTQSYSFDDNTPLSISYYRVVSIENNQPATYSKVVSVVGDKSVFGLTKMYPNPTSDVVNFDITTPTAALVSIELVDILGRTVFQKQFVAAEGASTLPLSMSGLQAGTYTVKLLSGNAVVMTRVVKL